MWSPFSLPCAYYFADVFLCLGLHMLYVNFENSKTCIASLDCLKGMALKSSSKV